MKEDASEHTLVRSSFCTFIICGVLVKPIGRLFYEM